MSDEKMVTIEVPERFVREWATKEQAAASYNHHNAVVHACATWVDAHSQKPPLAVVRTSWWSLWDMCGRQSWLSTGIPAYSSTVSSCTSPLFKCNRNDIHVVDGAFIKALVAERDGAVGVMFAQGPEAGATLDDNGDCIISKSMIYWSADPVSTPRGHYLNDITWRLYSGDGVLAAVKAFLKLDAALTEEYTPVLED